ncbi:MAG: Phosphoribosyl-AMP cyclohydrolase / Phosphoribosyl-ATP pyrophosphatase [uncultured Rubrobacteraceae bacterium]|uniref:Histidine biosynthesis bifunctional protein HisIE n=1 Tax=uncultured Rubrobacteraceae bacterium TaxID=349277 RepID=A0A6J4QR56_9ACTN|nr:MAG: Phosphoribosyl-AMP cyclohydrolase / Phosphoribosyl-ATP pyrophosphatase [uncultured Rubrobacteraceae bacterium]
MSAPEGIRYDASGLVPVVAQDAETGEVLMLAYASREAVEKTLSTGEAHYYSRSREEIWRKGATSGNTQKVADVRLDCDGDALLYRVEPAGPACHTGERSCFFTPLAGSDKETPNLARTLTRLARIISGRHREMPEGSYTAKLLERGTGYTAQKVGEEAVEVVVAALEGERLAEETADLLYHLLVLLEERGVGAEEVARVLDERHR